MTVSPGAASAGSAIMPSAISTAEATGAIRKNMGHSTFRVSRVVIQKGN
jgi:hypothetical protein